MLGKKNSKDELALLCELRNHARSKLTELSKHTSIPVSTVHERLKKPVLVKRYAALLDFKALGLGTQVQLLVKAGSNSKDSVNSILASSKYMNNLHRTSGAYDFVAELCMPDMQALEEFLEGLDDSGCVKREVLFVVEEVARERLLSRMEHVEYLHHY